MTPEDRLRGIIDDLLLEFIPMFTMRIEATYKILAWHKKETKKLHEYYKDLITQVHNDNKARIKEGKL
jgi:hypothetical protein